MTDNEIIKALECCSNEPTLNCRNCPYERACNMGKSDMQRDALDLISRQKAEIERLRQANKDICDVGGRLLRERKTIRAEAIKEFAERLKTYPIDCNLPLLGLETKQEIEAYFNSVMKQIDNAIDNLVKEMTEETTC